MKGPAKDEFLSKYKTKGRKDLSWVEIFVESSTRMEATMGQKREGHFTLHEILDFNKINIILIADERIPIVFDALLKENARKYKYDPHMIEGPCEELNRYFYIHVEKIEEDRMQKEWTASKTLSGASAAPFFKDNGAVEDSVTAKLEFPERHKMHEQCQILRSAVSLLDKKLIEIKELLCDVEIRAEIETALEGKIKELQAILVSLGAFIDSARIFLKKCANIKEEGEAAKRVLEAVGFIEQSNAHADGHKELKKRFAALLK